ncbi:MAG: recombinase family protein [Candidatus Omnitrophota bacterium]
MKIAIYARVSTEKQEKEETVNSQIEALRDYAQKNDLPIHQEYVDEGYSGELLDRPALDSLRDDAKKSLFEAVLVHSPDRLSRKYIYLGLVQEELKRSGINVVFLNRPDSKDTPEDNLLTGVQGLIAEYEKAKILERTRRGRIHKATSGFIVGGRAPYGYRYIKGDRSKNSFGQYEVAEEEKKVVRLIFSLFVERQLSIRAVTKELALRGIQPQRGNKWAKSSVHRILVNETYAGVTHYNKHLSIETDNHKVGSKYRRIKNTGRRLRAKKDWIAIALPDHLKIIDRAVFDAAQKQLKRNAELSPRNVKHEYLLRGLVKCGECDSPYYGTPCHGRYFYRCGNRDKMFPGPRTCKASMVSAPKLEDVAWNSLCGILRNPRLIIDSVDRLKKRAEKNGPGIEKEIEANEMALKKAGDEEDRLLDAYRANAITIAQLKDQMAKIQERKGILAKEKQELCAREEGAAGRESTARDIRDYCGRMSKRLKDLGGSYEGRRYVVANLLTRVAIENKKVRIKGRIPTRYQPNHFKGDIASISSS